VVSLGITVGDSCSHDCCSRNNRLLFQESKIAEWGGDVFNKSRLKSQQVLFSFLLRHQSCLWHFLICTHECTLYSFLEPGFELRALCLQTGTLPLEPHLQSILLWLFCRWGSHELFSQLDLNCSAPCLSLFSS
jgi:hypothetical protein